MLVVSVCMCVWCIGGECLWCRCVLVKSVGGVFVYWVCWWCVRVCVCVCVLVCVYWWCMCIGGGCWWCVLVVASFPGPGSASCCLQYGKVGEDLVHLLM